MRSVLAWVVLAAAIAGCSDGSGLPQPAANRFTIGPPQPFRSELLLADSEQALELDLVATRFNFVYLRDLWFRAKISGMPRVSTLSVKFTTPEGDTFYQDSFPFSPDPTMTTMSSPNAGHPLTVMRAKKIAGGYALDHLIPIAGTVFERFPKAGVWQVQASVEGVPGVLTSPLEVELSR
jgi:hypothetical protein